MPSGFGSVRAIRLGLEPFADVGANSLSWSGSAVDPSCSRRAILGSAPVTVGRVPSLKHEVAEAVRVRRSDEASLPEEAGRHLRAREWGAARLLAPSHARPRVHLVRHPFRRAACLIGPKCQDEGVMILTFPETVATLPGAMGSLHIAEALRGVISRAGCKPTVIVRGPEPRSPGLLGPNHGLAPGSLATVSIFSSRG